MFGDSGSLKSANGWSVKANDHMRWVGNGDKLPRQMDGVGLVMNALSHVTLNTGDARLSPRSEMRDDVVDMIKAVVAAGEGTVIGLHIVLESLTVFTLGWHSGRPAVRCWLSSERHPESWRSVGGQGKEPP